MPNVDEENRAFTSGMAGYPAGAQADHRFITVEVSNSPQGVRNGTWEISSSALEALARLIADVYRRYGLGAVRRGTSSGIAVHQDFVPTQCPGPYMMRKLPSVIARAEQLRTGGGTGTASKPKPKPKPKPALITEEDDEMAEQGHAYVRDAATNGQGSIYLIRNVDGKKRKMSKAEWNARRGSLNPKVTDISAAELKAIPNA
ncbi:N-acetylmuramoyl-L-alanine amidase [Leucobacter sp. USCH14]|uniref:peptidoglycan recognition protein family protein n=1 Tax=Leucobacter sp. USCH14 TaxID=3024838 RepID=UPI0030A0636E